MKVPKILKNENGKGGWILLLAILVLFSLPMGYGFYMGFTGVTETAQQLSDQSKTGGPETKAPDQPSEEEMQAFGIVYGLLIAMVWGMSAIWVYNDAANRGKSGCLVMLFTLLCAWPFSLLYWVMVRPKIVNSEKT